MCRRGRSEVGAKNPVAHQLRTASRSCGRQANPDPFPSLYCAPSLRFPLFVRKHAHHYPTFETKLKECFRDSVPEAIERGCYLMDTACLETQFRTQGRQCQCQCQNQSTDADTASPSSPLWAAGVGQFVRETGDAAEASPCMIACSRNCCGDSPENQSPRGSGAAKDGEKQRLNREISNESDARSRLSGAATGMVGGATAVVAIATKVGEV